MKIDPIFETKIIYFSEKIIELKSSEYILTSKEMDTYIDISDSERVINYLEKEKLIKRGYNNDFDTDGGLLDHSDINRDGLRNLIKKLKQNLREKPAIERNLIVQVARQLETIFDKNKWSSITSLFFSFDENDIYKYIKLERYSLTDFLFYSSYSKEFSIYDFLVEFLNPVYYDIKSEVTSQKVFEFISNIFSEKERSDWKNKATISKYLETLSDGKVLEINKISIFITDSGVSSLVDGKRVYYHNLKPEDKIYIVFNYLSKLQKPVKINELVKKTGQESKSIKRSINSLNSTARAKFNLDYDLIVSADNGLYYVDREHFNFIHY